MLLLALAAQVLALLPLENRSGVFAARADATALVRSRLQQCGFEVAPADAVESLLEERRVRHLDSLGPDTLQAFGARLQAAAVVTGAVDRYADGQNPSVALGLRFVAVDGTPFFWDVVSMTAGDTRGLFGRGRVTTRPALLARVVERLLATCPRPGGPVTTSHRGKPFRHAAARTYRGPVGAQRVVLLPLAETAGVPGAARTLTQLLWRRLDASAAFDVVEPAVVREALIAEKVRSLQEMDPAVLDRLAERLGTPLFLRGTVEGWRAELPHGAATNPRVACALTLTDVRAQRIVWTSQHEREGEAYEGLLRRGAITSVVGLADQVVSEMLESFDEARPVVARAGKEPR